jgi:hypothetical protein
LFQFKDRAEGAYLRALAEMAETFATALELSDIGRSQLFELRKKHGLKSTKWGTAPADREQHE